MQAACRTVDTALFYSPEGERGSRKARRELAAKQVCAACPVLEVCSTYAIAMREPYGTWGGLSESERRELWTRTDPAQAQLDHRRALARWEGHAHAQGA
jgi:WhiB family transcriptional regulator, redox-sensing transcriptional regulator